MRPSASLGQSGKAYLEGYKESGSPSATLAPECTQGWPRETHRQAAVQSKPLLSTGETLPLQGRPDSRHMTGRGRHMATGNSGYEVSERQSCSRLAYHSMELE